MTSPIKYLSNLQLRLFIEQIFTQLSIKQVQSTFLWHTYTQLCQTRNINLRARRASFSSFIPLPEKDSLQNRVIKIKKERPCQEASSQQKRAWLCTYAIDNVADPFPALASTTSIPPSCVLFIRALISSWGKLACSVAYKY